MNWSLALASAAGKTVVPWRPFLDPLPQGAFEQWILYLIPMAVLIAIAYKAVRTYELRYPAYIKSVAAMTAQILLGMIGLALASYLLVEVYVKWMRG